MTSEDGLIRCHSRLEKSGDLSFGEKFPIIGRNHFVRLLIYWIHASYTLHSSGISTNLHHIRSRFLVLRARSTTNKVLRDRMICREFRAKAASETTSVLPALRIEGETPFLTTGIYMAGPIKSRTTKARNSKPG